MTSLIIPVKDRVDLTLMCLVYLKENDSRKLKEVIIIDNDPGHTKTVFSTDLITM